MAIAYGTPKLVAATGLAVIIASLVHFLARGIAARRRFYKMKASGIPIIEPYSPFLGHLPLLRSLKEGLPQDAHRVYTSIKIVQNWQKYFPGAEKCPPLIYMDVWPFMAQPIIMVIDPELCSQLTQETPQPRHPIFGWALTPVTDGIDLISMNMPDHKVWRSRLNPGFSSRNIIQNMPAALEEVSIYAQKLKDTADAGSHEWGKMFTLYEGAVALTFDVVSRFALDLHPHEQTAGPGPLLNALRNLISRVKLKNVKTRLERLTPEFKSFVSQNAATMRDTLLPQIQSRFSDTLDSKNQKTVIDLAIKDFKNSGQQPTPEFINILISNLKAFLFAGHDTTAQTICWIFYEINKNPDILQRLRKEHDGVLGPDPKMAYQVLQQSPHKANELRYTAAVIKETLRIHTLANTFRQGSPDFNFSLDGMLYPTYDCMIQTAPTMTHIHPDFWPHPTEFIPDRFLVPEDHALYPVKNAWRPFELGNTKCIGQELAMLEMKLVLVFTLRELDFDFNYEQWDVVQKRDTTSVAADTINGERAYRCGEGIGAIKDDLPVRVRFRR
ncbi:sterigmatocystin biosynthesis P450 monooxygenase StcS [Histoplasma capsulatum var. duboisii H88]|uniref:Sterigmatocystin biosynthesis P450 monooxygenase StcS n=1 Tax=Ajellomyces capsulatus (strain H88) TaxID=544711 RepID=F0UJH2_AJEC8|nr:sterigmatocystin biosynthesis P450 monooxygenase StcS [Histoplasma capsulatum var. duboisii H88]QSS57184.1 sterigmatocystin biosynthesis P450 monooxygenase StcS [Histoplasma capsulatum var. duboisii H88]